VLLVTHDVDEAIALADRVLVLDGGRIAAEERIERPRPRDVDASFQAIRGRLLTHLGVGGHEPRPAQVADRSLVAFPSGEMVS